LQTFAVALWRVSAVATSTQTIVMCAAVLTDSLALTVSHWLRTVFKTVTSPSLYFLTQQLRSKPSSIVMT